jgi:uncharacterized lipoprotein YddW (UPF0748 family)
MSVRKRFTIAVITFIPRTSFFAILLFLTVIPANAGIHHFRSVIPLLVVSQPEYRGLWVDTWNPGILDESSTRLMVERSRQHNFNTLFVEAVKTMDAFYTSSLLPRGQGIAPDFDPLATVLRFAKSPNPKVRPLEVHAWVVAMRVWKDKPFPPRGANPQHVIHAHPEWLSKTNGGSKQDAESNHFLDPGHPEVQDFLVEVCKEIVRKYAVDGLHLDYIRYPGSEWGYNTVALNRFLKETGRNDLPEPRDEQWSSWRRLQLTNLVKRISVEIHAIRPQLKLSAATITWGGVPGKDFTKTRAYQETFQDWVAWIREGYLDLNVPMNYKRANHAIQTQDFVDWVTLARATNTNRHLIVGLGAWMNPLDATSRQTAVARRMKSEGVALFSYNQLESSARAQAPLMREVSGKMFKSSTVLPTAPWLKNPTTGVITGLDPKGRSHYPVLLLSSNKKELARTRTDANGYFHFFNVKPGSYLSQVGLASILSEPVKVTPGKIQRARF